MIPWGAYVTMLSVKSNKYPFLNVKKWNSEKEPLNVKYEDCR